MRMLRIGAAMAASATLVVETVLLLELEPHRSKFLSFPLTPFLAVACLAPALVGLSIAIRQPRNVIAWLLLVGAFTASQPGALIPDHGWSLQVQRASWPLLYAWPLAVASFSPMGGYSHAAGSGLRSRAR
jgi:hypothetical protein